MNNVGHTANNSAVNCSTYLQQQILSGYKLTIEVELEKHISAKRYLQVCVVWDTWHGLQSLQRHLDLGTLAWFEVGIHLTKILFCAYGRVISQGFLKVDSFKTEILLEWSSPCRLAKEKKKAEPMANHIGDTKDKFLERQIPFCN